jgi:hypothetical protein
MRKAILFSTVWHLFWMTAIGIIVTPSVQPSDVYQEVGFLGPILEKTAFDLMVEEVTPQAETLYAKSTFFLDSVYLKPEGPGRKVLKEFKPRGFLNRLAFLKNFIENRKETPLYAAGSMRPSYAKPDRKELPLTLEGPAGKREIIFKPEPPRIPRGLYGDAEEYRVRLKFFVSADGIVYDLKPVVSSGCPEIDLRTIRFLKRWRFSPLSVVEKKKPPAWGIATVKVVTK